jgi:geranylgeranyl reductase family protein
LKETIQIPAGELPDETWDVVIAGAGPAGSICAFTLARKGYRVLLLDKERFPRHKTCGDMLIPDAGTQLERLGLLDRVAQQAVAIDNIQVFSPSRVKFNVPGRYHALPRYDFDYILAQAAVEAGAVFSGGHVSEIEQDTDGVRFKSSGRWIKARIGVIATGAAVELAQHLGMVSRPQASAIAIRYYVRSSYPLRDTILSYDRPFLPGYAWLIPVRPDLFNVGCGIRLEEGNGKPPNLKKHLRHFEADFPAARDLLAQGKPVSKIAGAALRCGLTGVASYVNGRVLAIGETIGTTFPFTGEGIGKALQTAVIASDVIGDALEDSPDALNQFAERIDTEIRPYYHGYYVAERWLGHAWLNDFLSRRVLKSRYLQQQLRDFVSETGDPRALFSVASVLKSFWK